MKTGVKDLPGKPYLLIVSGKNQQGRVGVDIS
jgi:hypothetical protein